MSDPQKLQTLQKPMHVAVFGERALKDVGMIGKQEVNSALDPKVLSLSLAKPTSRHYAKQELSSVLTPRHPNESLSLADPAIQSFYSFVVLTLGCEPEYKEGLKPQIGAEKSLAPQNLRRKTLNPKS